MARPTRSSDAPPAARTIQCAHGPRDLRDFCKVGEGSDALLRTAITRLGLSARAYHRVLKIARTIADLAGSAEIETAHVGEAIQYRSLDRHGGPAVRA